MKKILTMSLLAAAVVGLNAYAAGEKPSEKLNSNGYFSKQHPLMQNASVKAAYNAALNKAMVAPTDIIVNNATFNTIYLHVVDGAFIDDIRPRGLGNPYDHIFNYRGAYYTKIELRDPNNYVFYSATVCPRASLTVFGYTPYDVVVDIESCKR